DGEPAAVGVEQDLRGVRPGWEGPEARNAADVVFAVAHVLGLSGGLVPLVEDRTEQPHRQVGHAGEQLAPVGVERAQGVRFGRDARRCGGRRRGHQFLLRVVTDRDRSGVWRRTHCDESAWSVTVPMWNEPGVPERNTHCAVTEGYHRGTRGTVNGGLSSLAQVMDIRHPDETAGSAGDEPRREPGRNARRPCVQTNLPACRSCRGPTGTGYAAAARRSSRAAC